MKNKTLKILVIALALIFISLSFVACGSGNEVPRSEEFKMTDAVDELNAVDGDYILIAFPGLSVEPLVLNRAAFKIGNVKVYWTAIITVLCAVAATVYVCIMAKKKGIESTSVFDLTAWGVIGSVVGARLYYVLNAPISYKGRFAQIFNITDGGFAVFGALIGGALAIAVICKIKKISVLEFYDFATPAIMAALAFGRLGDVVSGQSYGYEIKESGLFYGLRMGIYPHLNAGITESDSRIAYVHPTFIYEFIWLLIGFALICFLASRKKKANGQLICVFLSWYGVGRVFTELLRTDSLYLFGTIRISALVGCLAFFAGVAFLAYSSVIGKKQRLKEEEYESAYPLFGTKYSRAKNEESIKEEENKDETD